MSILNEIIVDENLGWDKSLNTQIEKIQVDLDKKSLNELIENRDNLTKSSIDDYPSLKEEMTILNTTNMLKDPRN